MRNFISILLVILVSFGIVITDAHAKRFGGGRSFGTYRSSNSFSRAQPASSPLQNIASPNKNRWLGPLAGLAAGGLLASLFMGNGLGSGMMSWLMIAGVVMLLISLVRGFSRNRMQSASPTSPFNNMFRDNLARDTAPQSGFNNYSPASHSSSYPAGFDEYEFLRSAKVQFIRLQAAYDKKNLQDISQFTTPEIYAEIKLQLQERGDNENQTDVVTLDAKLLDATTEYQTMIASVQFSGLIKEDINEPSVSFNEIWHFHKDANTGTWLTAGIQQNTQSF